MTKLAQTLAILSLISVASISLAQTNTDAFTGTWKLNVAKSQYGQGPAPSSEILTIAPDGRTTIEAVTDGGKTSKWSFPRSDGKEVSIDGVEHGTIIEKRSARQSDYTMKIGEVTVVAHVVVSDDGRTITRTFDASDSQGHGMHGVAVYEKYSQ